jgi:glycosyltransferase involved in cell wall biosynthesis
MNILFLDQFSDLGGAQRCLVELLPAVRDRGWRAHVAAPGEGALRDEAIALGSPYRQIRSGPYESGGKSISDLFRFTRELPRLAREIANLAADCRAEIVYVNGPRLLPAASLGLPPATSLVFHCHSYLRQHYAAALAGISLASARATVIASCRFVAQPLRPYIHSTVIYNGVDSGGADPLVRGRPPGRPSVNRIGVLGRISPEKGQLDFLKAAHLLPPHYQFIICGAPLFSNPAAVSYFDRVREQAANLPVEFLGWRDDVSAVLSTLDLLVVPSAPGEATTRVILEAFAAGVPVVATASGGIPEIVSDGETGLLTPPCNPARLSARIRDAATNPSALQRIAANAQRTVRERFTLAQYQGQVMSILERVGGGPGWRPPV